MKKKTILILICVLSVLNISAEVYSGSCGDNVNFSLDTSTGVLSITGTGAMTNYAFSSYSDVPWYSNRSYIKIVEISDGVTTIGDWNFYDCSDLTSINIPNSVTSLGKMAFYKCSRLPSIELTNSVTEIGKETFRNCSCLTELTIPSSVTSIGFNAFSMCYFEKKDFINNSTLDAKANGYWGALIVDSRENGFVIKDGTLIKYTGNETSVTIPNSVTSIGDNSFSACTGLTSVVIGNDVTSIGDYAFSSCSGLLDIYCYAEQIPTTGLDVFKETPISQATLHVPAASVNSYKAAEQWEDFGSIVALTDEALKPTGIVEVRSNTSGARGVHYDLNGRKLNGESNHKGLYIVNGKKVIACHY